MKAPCRSRQVNERGFVEDLAAIKQIGRRQDSASPLQLDLSPVIGGLKYHFAVGLGF